MSRFLFVVPPLAGHVNPTAAVGAELAARGHGVAWAGHPGVVGPLLPAGATLYPAGDGLGPEALEEIHARWLHLRGFAALKALWEEVLVPLAEAMAPGVGAAIDDFAPDVVVADQQALAGAALAERAGIPWATSASTFSELVNPYAGVPQVAAWVSARVRAVALACGLSPEQAARVDLRFSPRLVLVYSTPELVGSVGAPCNPVFVGPAVGPRPADPPFAWDWLDAGTDRRRRVLVSLGTHNGEAGQRFFRVVLDAVAQRVTTLQVIVVAPAGTVAAEEAGDNVLVVDRVPQVALLGQVDAVVSHAGHNTVSESLAAGRPLVLAPIRDDQPIVGDRVAAAGAGVRVRFGRVQPAELDAAITAVLDDPSYRQAAGRIGAAFAAAGGAAAAADHLEKIR